MVGSKQPLSLVVQEKAIAKYFPDAKICRNKEISLSAKVKLRPSPLSPYYIIKVKFIKGKSISTYVVEPAKLRFHKGEVKLPHVYSTPEQQLCLYYPDKKEWNECKLIINTIIPWASEWLFFYEVWVITGKWLGGGINHGLE